MTIFANPAVQAVFDQVVMNPPIGDYQNGVRAYALCKARNGYVPDGDSPKTHAELNQYLARVRVFETGYDEAAADERYQIICELSRIIKRG
jgi:hypothetical protein